MAYSLNGTGTTFYGKRDFRADGTYLTTEWIALFCIPLIPIRSLRVKYKGSGEHRWYLGLGSSSNYAVYEKSFPNWKQVLCTYGYVGFMFCWVYLICTITASIIPHTIDPVFSVSMIFIMCIIPVPTPWILRHFAKKQVYERHNA
jgi:hypothetical protein